MCPDFILRIKPELSDVVPTIEHISRERLTRCMLRSFSYNKMNDGCSRRPFFEIELLFSVLMEILHSSSGSPIVWRNAVNPVLSGHSIKDQTLVFKTDYCLMLVKSIAEFYCRVVQENILQCLRPSLSNHLSLRPLSCLFLRGRLRQVLLFTSKTSTPRRV